MYARTWARGLWVGGARASTVPDETVPALGTLSRTRRDLGVSQRAARQRLHDEVGPVFPELVGQLPDHADRGAPAILRLLAVSSSAHALAHAPLDDASRGCSRRAVSTAGDAPTPRRCRRWPTWPVLRRPAPGQSLPVAWGYARWPCTRSTCTPRRPK